MKKLLLFALLIAIMSNAQQAIGQIQQLSLRNFAIIQIIPAYQQQRGVPTMIHTQPGVRRIVATSHNVSISFGDVVIGEQRGIVTFSFDEQGRLTAVGNRRIRWQGNDISAVENFNPDGSLGTRYAISGGRDIVIEQSGYVIDVGTGMPPRHTTTTWDPIQRIGAGYRRETSRICHSDLRPNFRCVSQQTYEQTSVGVFRVRGETLILEERVRNSWTALNPPRIHSEGSRTYSFRNGLILIDNDTWRRERNTYQIQTDQHGLVTQIVAFRGNPEEMRPLWAVRFAYYR